MDAAALTDQIERGVLCFFKGNLTVSKNQTNLDLQKGGKQLVTLRLGSTSGCSLNSKRVSEAAKLHHTSPWEGGESPAPPQTHTTERSSSSGIRNWLCKGISLVPNQFYFSKTQHVKQKIKLCPIYRRKNKTGRIWKTRSLKRGCFHELIPKDQKILLVSSPTPHSTARRLC